MKKLLISLLIFCLLFCILVVSLVISVNKGLLNQQVQKILQTYLAFHNLEAEFSDFKIKDSLITFKKAEFSSKEGWLQSSKLEIDNFQMKIEAITDLSAKLNLISANIKLLAKKDGELLAFAKLTATKLINFKGLQRANCQFSEIELFDKIKDINNKTFNNGEAKIHYDASKLSAEIKFAQNDAYINYVADATETKNQLLAKNIPVLLHQLITKINHHYKLPAPLYSSIKNGYIAIANITFIPEAIEYSLDGKVNITDFHYNYHSTFPDLTKIQAEINLDKTKIKMLVKQAYSNRILLKETQLDLDWQNFNEAILYIKAKANGPVSDLTNFVKQETLKKTAESDIDLTKLKGKANTDIIIEMPLIRNSKAKYDISVKISQASLDFFQKYAKLRQAEFTGHFNGTELTFQGTGKLNGFKANFDFSGNFTKDHQFNHKLDTKIYFKASSEEQKIIFVSLLGGSSVVDIHYNNEEGKKYIKVDTDISKLDLYFDKLGIRKKLNSRARMSIYGYFNNVSTGMLDFHIRGEDNLNIEGNINITGQKTSVELKEIKSQSTDISGRAIFDGDNVTADIEGTVLDLSNADMMEFLEKERDKGNSRFRINVEKVKLKNDIWLDQLRVILECDSQRCFSGYIDSRINDKIFEMLLIAKDKTEEWLINCDDAGSLLRGIGVYDSIEAGSLNLKISTSRQEIRPGEIIPILDGNFTLSRFEVKNTPSIARLVSIMSLPGLFGILKGNKDIFFSNMNGLFSFDNNLLNINHSFAQGPYFDFSLRGAIDVGNKQIDIQGHVNPELYGLSRIIKAIPLIGRIINGNEKKRGLISGSYHIDQNY